MGLTEIYQEGEKILRGKEFGWVLDAVETGFIVEHDRRILDRYTFRPQYIDGVEPETTLDPNPATGSRFLRSRAWACFRRADVPDRAIGYTAPEI